MGAAHFNIDGRVIVVTGGLGQLGRQYAGAFLEWGARVAVLDLPEPESLAPERLEWLGPDAAYFCCDVTSRDSVASALAAVEARWGQAPYGLVNNAALDSPPGAPAGENGPFETYPESSWDKVMAVNAKGVLLVCQVFGGAMARAGRGSIVNVASTYGVVSPDQRLYEYRRRTGEPFFKPVAYAASKSALLNMTRYMATYFAPSGVRVNAVTLGGVFNGQDEEVLEGYAARTPLGRMAREDEYNGVMVFLMSDAASYMTGSNLVVDGGWTAW